MPPESFLTTTKPAASRSRSRFSLFSQGLGKNARNLFDLAVEPEDPFRVYSPGQAVKGHVILTVAKGFDITHLVIALHGYVKVYKHQIAPGERLAIPEGVLSWKGDEKFQYHGGGLATLWQKEQTLCGSGFLKKHVYKFAFELQFPTQSLPSAIDFERGTISYMVTATVTRPTTISPTVSRSTKLKYQDSIDIASMYTPKSRVVTLEPISKRGKVKVVRPPPSLTLQNLSTAGRLTRNNTQNSTTSRSTSSAGDPPLSPAPSDDTIQSATTSTSTQSYQAPRAADPSTPKVSPQASDARSNTTSSSAQTITATTELPRHGALPGDTIPIRITITHTKTDVRGIVIATLYRQCRVDMQPTFPSEKSTGAKKANHDDIYGKSRTGLGGLYFTTASPNSVFRKDLAQSSTMMVVNPATMTADIRTSLRIPDTAFPTIANVPGGMISFTYHVEVIVDLFGKLGETRLWPRLTSGDPVFTQSAESGNQLSSDWSHTILDTSQLRRMSKSVIDFPMSLVIGTHDSSRRSRQNMSFEQQAAEAPAEWQENDMYGAQPWHREPEEQYYDDHPHPYDGYDYNYGHDSGYYPEYPGPSLDLIPPPEGQGEMDEKAQLRRQEQLLMPSEPPRDGEPSSSPAAYAPTAPVIPSSAYGDDLDGHFDATLPSTFNAAASVVSARSGETIRPHSASPPPVPTAGDGDEPTDDKRELERQRLLAQRSAPPQEHEEQASRSQVAEAMVPSAPTIDEQDEYNVRTLNDVHMGSDLPQYER
ncbi:ph-response sensor protein [Elasticomyces elasticus]|uniref:Ph-response sensor protein n=1 Tax=Exophiala sideris TaxID=1016849 RepID=A0ABR0JBZ3_9EURO|nr:ph-response sensor protein [Elasticomyces elasticus]KAK5026144.1 ph-response sensor protein [Exophiala sideris]KAK5032398.1 ph-response sensor protein [Exophiala sideris]KAK5059554.1 ph-response sensor protein [Exophiala sideris]KAK5178163.1 ph-response sensor protein [Eurotiomycetes sp. CCFEE 6388]